MPTMPNVVGLRYAAAQFALQQAGVLGPLGYFSTFPISAQWQQSLSPPSTVLAQSVASGNAIAGNAPLTLTLAEFPISVAFP